MPIERDPESTKFDHRPWGGQQRLVPLAARFARGTDGPTPENADKAPAVRVAAKAPAARPVVINPAKAPAVTRPVVINPAKASKAAAVTRSIAAAATPAPTKPAPIQEEPDFRSRPTQDSLPMARVSNPVEVDTSVALPSIGKTVSMSAPVEPASLPMITPVPGTLPPAPSTSLPTVAMKAVDVSTDLNPAQPAFVPVVQYPAVAMYAAPPAMVAAPAIAVSSARAPRSVPAFSMKEGRALGGFVVPHLPKVAEVFRSSDATIAVRRRPLTARSIIAIPVGAIVATVAILVIYLAQPAQAKSAASAASTSSEPQVMMVVAEPAVVMQTVSAPAAAPVVLAAPIAAEPVVVAEPVIVDAEPAAVEKAPSKKHRSKRHRKPRRITAVDASTPLGNLRADALERP